VGQNPPFGAVIHYVLPGGLDEPDAEEVTLEILDADGDVIRALSSTTPERRAPSPWRRMFPEMFEPPLLDARAGANRYVWNLAHHDAELVDDAVLWGFPGGPRVPPGTYQARLSVGEWTETVSFDVVQDPRTEIAPGDFAAQYELATDIWQALSRSHATIERIRSIRSQVRELAESTGDEAVEAKADEIAEALTAVEEKLTQTKSESSQDVLNFPPQIDNQLVYLQGIVGSTLGAPLASSQQRFDELSAEIDGYEAAVDGVVAEQLPEFERLLDEMDEPRVRLDQ
jgi:hypothetical protein